MGVTEFLNPKGDFAHIPYKVKLERAMKELEETKSSEILERGRDIRDNTLGGIFGGKLYLIGAETGTGKTTFVNQVCKNVSSQGARVVRYSLEDRMEDAGKEELYHEMNRLMKADGKKGVSRVRYIRNELPVELKAKYLGKAYETLEGNNIIELDKQKNVTIDNLVELMEEEAKAGAKLFVVDHLHYFEFDGPDRMDLQIKNVMHRINEIARKHNIPILLVAHYKSNTGESYEDRPTPSFFRDGSAIKQVSNVIIQIQRDHEDEENPSLFYLTKIRGPIKKTCIKAKFDIKTYEYDFNFYHKQDDKYIH